MVLVFYIAMIITFILLILLIIAFLITISKLEVNIKDLDISNINKRENNKNILIQISLKIKKVHWIKIKMDKEKMANLYVKIKKQEDKNNINSAIIKEKLKEEAKNIFASKELKELILDTRIELEKLDLNIGISTEDNIVTSFLVAIISIIISNILPHIISNNLYYKDNIEEKINYKISPIYKEKNMYYIHLMSSVSTDISHLIKIMFNMIKLRKENKKELEEKYVKEINNIEKIDKKLNVKPV